MDNPLQSAIQKMGSNFLVAAFVPSIAFIVASYVAFQPLLPANYRYDPEIPADLIQSGFILLLAATILGFTLYTLSTYIYKLFEGYTFLLGTKSQLRTSFLKRQMLRYKKITSQKAWVQQRLKKINAKIELESSDAITGKWRNKRMNRLTAQKGELEKLKYSLTSDLDHNFPMPENLIMPTRFGNVLRAAEMYPKRYGIDAVPIWTKLVCAIPAKEGMMEKINEANNQCQFLLNGAILWVLFSASCIVAAVYAGILCWSHTNSILTNPGVWALIYCVLAVISFGFAFFFYEASLFNVGQFGDMIRATYDLYRFNLLNALHLKLPDTLQEEKKIWLKLSHFVTGNLDYVEPNEEEQVQEEGMDFSYTHPAGKTP